MPPLNVKIPVGISSCLLGQKVRYDGGHKHDRFITDALGDYFRWIPVCPEVEIGLGTPREAIRLIRSKAGTRLVSPESGLDLTNQMASYSQTRLESLIKFNIRGYILKKDSPTCGMARVRVYDQKGVPARTGVGLFAQALLERFPNLPVEEEGRLQDARLLENFVTRVFTYDRWLHLREHRCSSASLIRFHTEHKLLLLAHHPGTLKSLGQLVSQSGSLPLRESLGRYEDEMMQALKKIPTARRHVNVMQHLSGFLKNVLHAKHRQELARVIEEYAQGWIPLIAPLTLLQHHLKQLQHPWVEAQIYLEPYPRALALRSRI